MDYDDTFCEKDKTKCGQLDKSLDDILVLKEEIARLSELNDLQDGVIARLTLENTGLRITKKKEGSPPQPDTLEDFVYGCEIMPLKFWWSRADKNFIWFMVHEKHMPAGIKFERIWMRGDDRFDDDRFGITEKKEDSHEKCPFCGKDAHCQGNCNVCDDYPCRGVWDRHVCENNRYLYDTNRAEFYKRVAVVPPANPEKEKDGKGEAVEIGGSWRCGKCDGGDFPLHSLHCPARYIDPKSEKYEEWQCDDCKRISYLSKEPVTYAARCRCGGKMHRLEEGEGES